MRIVIVLSVLIIISSITDSSHADIYKYVDKNGVIHFTNMPQSKDYKKIMSDNRISKNDKFNNIIRSKSRKYRIEPSVIKALIAAESNWDTKAVSEKGAMGLMQLMPSTARDMLINNPFDPEQNIEGGTRYLRKLLDKFDGDLDLALAAYNAGPSKVEKANGIPSIPETRKYVRKVISMYNGKSGAAQTRIYKVTYDDGTVLYTNTPRPYKKHKLSNF